MNKKIAFTLALSALSVVAMADDLVATATELENGKVIEESKDSVAWKFPGSLGINANQAYFNDYSTEGSGASVSLDAFLNLNANYKKKRVLWENSLSAKYGMIYSTEFTGDDKVRKNVDEFNVNTKYGYKLSKAWYLSAFANFESQFAKGYEYLEDVNKQDSAAMISNFFAPGYVKVSLGMECIPNKYVSFFVSPITARFTFCRLDELGDKYGMKLITPAEEAVYNETGDLVKEAVDAEYEHNRKELGAYAKIKSDFDITKSIHFFSTLEGFYAYNKAVETHTDAFVDWYGLNYEKADFSEDAFADAKLGDKFMDVNGWYIKWKLELLLKVSKYVNVSLKTQLKYDNAEKKVVEGNNFGLPQAKLQFWETVSLGFAYSF